MYINCIKIGFELGLINKDELISFCENKILQNYYNDMCINIASLSLNVSNQIFLETLKENNIAKMDFSFCHPLILYYLKKETADWKKLQMKMIKYYDICKKKLDFENFEFWSRIKDDYELRKDGFSGCMKMPKELFDYINTYKTHVYSSRLLDEIIRYSNNNL